MKQWKWRHNLQSHPSQTFWLRRSTRRMMSSISHLKDVNTMTQVFFVIVLWRRKLNISGKWKLFCMQWKKNVSASHVLNKVCTTSKRHGRSQKVHARTTCVQENCFQDIENAVNRMFVTSNDATFSHYDKKIFTKKDYFYVTKSINFMSQKQEPF